jgi:5,10-methylenetetrahydrofolate reductase
VRIDERLAAGGEPGVSFELVPPRSVEAELALWRAVDGLLDGGAPWLHFYTFNRSPATRSIRPALRARGGWAARALA